MMAATEAGVKLPECFVLRKRVSGPGPD